MSQKNVEMVQRAYEDATARLEMLPELFDADLELDAKDVSPEFGEVVSGLKAARELLRDYWETFEDFHVEIEEVLHADEEQVVDAVRDGGRIRGSDAEVWNHFFHVWSFGDGKIIRLSIHSDRNRALEAAGLRD
jgi:ketosteroid isomerase-like protein